MVSWARMLEKREEEQHCLTFVQANERTTDVQAKIPRPTVR